MHHHPLEDLIEQYLAEKDICLGSYELYYIILKQFTTYLKDHQILYATTIDVINYREAKRNQAYSVRWIYHQISTLKGLYQYLSFNQKRLGLPEEYAFDITESIKNEHIIMEDSKPFLTIEQAKHLILTTQKMRKYIWHYRDHALIYLMIPTGMRSVEIRRAKIKDLKTINNQSILDVQGKGRTSKDEFVKITKGVETAINDYLNKRKDKNPYLFISHSHHTEVLNLSRTFFLRMLRRVLKDTGLEETGVTPHALRHTAATLNLLRGASLEDTRRFMRYTNMSSTLIYAHHINRIEDDSEDQIENYILKEEKF